MMRRFFRKEKGFTLIKPLVIVAIIVIALIIAKITIPRFLGPRVSSVARAFANMERIAEALEKYHADKGEYPANLTELTERNYIASIPRDPWEADYRYYTNYDANTDPPTPATHWLIISNGLDGFNDVPMTGKLDFTLNPVSGKLGGPDGVIGEHYFPDSKWARGKEREGRFDYGDIGLAGP